MNDYVEEIFCVTIMAMCACDCLDKKTFLVKAQSEKELLTRLSHLCDNHNNPDRFEFYVKPVGDITLFGELDKTVAQVMTELENNAM